MAQIYNDTPLRTNEVSEGLHNIAQPAKGVKMKMVWHKLQSGVYLQGVLKQKVLKYVDCRTWAKCTDFLINQLICMGHK